MHVGTGGTWMHDYEKSVANTVWLWPSVDHFVSFIASLRRSSRSYSIQLAPPRSCLPICCTRGVCACAACMHAFMHPARSTQPCSRAMKCVGIACASELRSLHLGTPQRASRELRSLHLGTPPSSRHFTLSTRLALLWHTACALCRTWQYDNATAMSAIALAFNAGFTHIDTAESYKNQVRDSVERYGRRIAWPRRPMPRSTS
jgi:hypothetical protein